MLKDTTYITGRSINLKDILKKQHEIKVCVKTNGRELRKRVKSLVLNLLDKLTKETYLV